MSTLEQSTRRPQIGLELAHKFALRCSELPRVLEHIHKNPLPADSKVTVKLRHVRVMSAILALSSNSHLRVTGQVVCRDDIQRVPEWNNLLHWP